MSAGSRSTLVQVNRRIVTLLAALAPIVVLGILGTVITVPYVALGPGPTFNTLGEVGGEEVVAIEGTEVDDTTGHLNMTTVAVRDDLNVFEAFGLWASGRQGIVPREEVYPPDKSKDEVKQENDADFQQSEDSAELAALHFLGKPVDLRIAKVGEDGPSQGLLREGDVLVSVDGKPVSTVGGVQAAVADVPPEHGGADRDPPRRRRNDGAGGARRTPGRRVQGLPGITPEEIPDVPFTIDFNLADVGGPSAGSCSPSP